MGISVLGEYYASIFRIEQIETLIMYQITTQRDTQEDVEFQRCLKNQWSSVTKGTECSRMNTIVGHVAEQVHKCRRIKETTL